ncbi:MAG: mechanosensitive ion channel domain-containing protein [Gemmatimonadaceae bacterium]
MNSTLQGWLFDPTVGRLLVSVLGIAIITAVVRTISKSAGRLIDDSDARYRVRKLITFAGYAGAILLVTTVYSDRLSGLTVAFGVAGAGVAFALQEVIASVAGWIALTFSNFYSPGDRVQLGGIKGDVIDIGVLRTTLMEVGDWVNGDLYNGRIVRVANSFVFKAPVFNYSGDFPFLWDEIQLPVKYGADRAEVRALCERITNEVVGEYSKQAATAWLTMLRQFRLEDARVEPMITLIANDNWLEYTIRYVVDYRRRRGTKDELFNKLLDAIDATNGRIALASATFQLVEAPPFRVQLEGDASRRSAP